MDIVNTVSGRVRKITVTAGSALALVVSFAAGATAQTQEIFDSRQSIYIDGSTPVDARTKARVDAYFDEIRNREEARAEDRERFNRFIYHDNIFGAQQIGRW